MRKDWVFTMNNPDIDPEALIQRVLEWDRVDYMVFQLERGEKGTEHYQGYIELKRTQRMKTVSSILGHRPHLEPRRGTREQARDYAMKEESRVKGPWTLGEWKIKNPGKRTDLTKLRDDVLERKKTKIEIIKEIENNQQLRFVEGLVKYSKINNEYKKKKVFWCYGKTGEGKTRWCYGKIGDRLFATLDTVQWFDGYYGQKVVLIDELRATDWPYRKMLKLLDGYEMLVPFKGGYVIWEPEEIYITTPYNPEDTYYLQAQQEGGIDQLLRRITQIKLFGEENRREIITCISANNYFDEISNKNV